MWFIFFFFFSSRRRHTRCSRDWSSDVCSSDLAKRIENLNDLPDVTHMTLDNYSQFFGKKPFEGAPWSVHSNAQTAVSCKGHFQNRRDEDRKSTRLNSSHGYISYAVFCLKKKRGSHQKDADDATETRLRALRS